MSTKPINESLWGDIAGCQGEHEAFLLVHRGVQFHAVHDKEHLHRGVRDAFVSVNEPVVADKRVAKCAAAFSMRLG